LVEDTGGSSAERDNEGVPSNATKRAVWMGVDLAMGTAKVTEATGIGVEAFGVFNDLASLASTSTSTPSPSTMSAVSTFSSTSVSALMHPVLTDSGYGANIGANFGGIFFRGHISFKNRTYCPLFSHDSMSFKDTCLFIYLK
jgi:hypothetical protein